MLNVEVIDFQESPLVQNVDVLATSREMNDTAEKQQLFREEPIGSQAVKVPQLLIVELFAARGLTH
jgi:hypothetical protein